MITLRDIRKLALLIAALFALIYLGGVWASEDQARASIAPPLYNNITDLMNNQTTKAPGPVRLPGHHKE